MTHIATSSSVMSFLVAALIPCFLASALSSLMGRADSLSSTSAAALAGLEAPVRKGTAAASDGREPLDVLPFALKRAHELGSDLCSKREKVGRRDKEPWKEIKTKIGKGGRPKTWSLELVRGVGDGNNS